MLYQLIGLPNFGLCMISDLKKRQPIEEIADEPYKPDSVRHDLAIAPRRSFL